MLSFGLRVLIFSCFLLFHFTNASNADIHVSRELRKDELVVLFNDSNEKIAKEVVEVYLFVKSELEKTIGWKVDFRPTVIISKDRNALKKATFSDLIVALAIPERNLILIDSSRVYTKPFTLKTTIKHELCHLLLHANIDKENLPRWLDEGVCQWTSSGIAEVIMNKEDVLAKAVMSGGLISLQDMITFPNNDTALLLSYEQSKSLVKYIVEKFGRVGLLNLLESLRNGDRLEDAVWKNFSLTISELEEKWHVYLKKKHTIFYYFSQNVYLILFLFAGLITIYGFTKLWMKKRAYIDVDEDDEDSRHQKGKL